MEGYQKMNGVWVDERLPQEYKDMIANQHKKWKDGGFQLMRDANGELVENALRTMYEHAFLLGSGVGIPPEPLKPLCAQHEGSDLEKIIEARKRFFPPGEEFVRSCAECFLDNFYEITGLPEGDYIAVMLHPEIAEDGTVGMPKVVRILDASNDEPIELSDEVISKLHLVKNRSSKTSDGMITEWEFSPEYGMKITYKGRTELEK